MNEKSFHDPNTGLQFAYPMNWEIETNGKIISVYNPEGVGALQFSIYQGSKMPAHTRDYLQSLLNKHQISTEVVVDRNYDIASFIDDAGKYWKYWLVHTNSKLIFATYNCYEADSQKEINEMETIVRSATI